MVRKREVIWSEVVMDSGVQEMMEWNWGFS